MGLFADLKAMRDVQRIKSGGKASLSVSSISNMIINLPNANRNLSKDDYDKVIDIYSKMRKCTTKIDMDIEGYYKITIDILCEFDKVVPCEPYLGLEPFEASLLMNEIRKSNCAHEAIQHLEMFKSGDV